MAMQFARATGAQAPDLAGAEAMQAKIDQQRRNAQQLRMQGLGSGAFKVADELGGTDVARDWLSTKLAGDTATAGLAGGGVSTATMAGVPTAAGAVNASAAPTTAALLSGGSAAPAMSAAGTGAGAALGSGSGAAAAAPALMSNPVGWGVLAALALGSMYAASQ